MYVMFRERNACKRVIVVLDPVLLLFIGHNVPIEEAKTPRPPYTHPEANTFFWASQDYFRLVGIDCILFVIRAAHPQCPQDVKSRLNHKTLLVYRIFAPVKQSAVVPDQLNISEDLVLVRVDQVVPTNVTPCFKLFPDRSKIHGVLNDLPINRDQLDIHRILERKRFREFHHVFDHRQCGQKPILEWPFLFGRNNSSFGGLSSLLTLRLGHCLQLGFLAHLSHRLGLGCRTGCKLVASVFRPIGFRNEREELAYLSPEPLLQPDGTRVHL
mmetsp:Transcript_14298/g.40608  ORF Transcript_14298/g.40608 Transcript_14298/m.40608 type:complete len:270 (-) Transcript_14298:2625-3434(-)